MNVRMMRVWALLAVAAFPAAAWSQPLTPRQRYERYLEISTLVRGGRVDPVWLADGTSFYYQGGTPDSTVLVRVDGQGHQSPLLDVGKVRGAMAALLGRSLPYRGLPFESFVPRPDGRLQFVFEGSRYALDTTGYRIELIPKNSFVDDYYGLSDEARLTPRSYEAPQYSIPDRVSTEILSPDGRNFVSVKAGNLVLRSTTDGRSWPLTDGGTPEYGWTTEGPRIALKAGGVIGYKDVSPWSPDGFLVYAMRIDRRSVEVESRIHWLKRNEEIVPIRVTRAGGALDELRPFVISILSKDTIPLDVGETRDRYLSLVGWRPDGSEVLLAKYQRDFKRMDLYACRPAPKACRVLLTETAPTFVAIQHEVIYYGNNEITPIPDGSGFLYLSTRSGWKHLYRYDYAGKLVGQLTQGDFSVLSVDAIDPKGGVVYLSAHSDPRRPYDIHILKVPLAGGPAVPLTQGAGQHAATFSPSFRVFADVHSTVAEPLVTDLRSTADGRVIARLGAMDTGNLVRTGWTAPEEYTVKAADGVTDLWGVMYKPADFDPAKKYPVIEWIYGGPQIVWCSRGFSAPELRQQSMAQALAQLGYVVVCLDARGTPERSKAFQDVVYQAWAANEIPDHAAGIRQLARRFSFLDSTRVGIYGHSWGGYFTIAAMTQAPELYRVGVASSPGLDPYDSILYEPYLGGVPGPGTKAAYDRADLIAWAPAKLRGKLLLVAGSNDNTVFTESMRLTHALIEAGFDHEFVVLPEQYHGYATRPERYYLTKTVDFFGRWLRP